MGPPLRAMVTGKGDSHQILQQHGAYRRGMVLGLTMAEAGILVIFVLLLLVGVSELLREEQERALDGRVVIPAEQLKSLEEAEATLQNVREALGVTEKTIPEEIVRLVRIAEKVATTAQGQTALREARAVAEEMRRIKEEIAKAGGSKILAEEVERQSYIIANQEGQIKRLESMLKDAGLGKGERPCWVRPDGTIDYLYEVVLSSSGIRMREIHLPHRQRERARLPMPAVDPMEVLAPGEFLRKTEALYNYSLTANCRFFVVVYDATGPTEKELYKQLLRTVEGHFYKRLDRGQAPF